MNISIHAPPRGATKSHGCGRTSRQYFNSRPSARGDGFPETLLNLDLLFQFTPLREGRPRLTELEESTANFNSRPSARGDENGYVDMARIIDFNSRPSARGDRRFFQRILRWLKNFNSRPSARGDRSGRRLSRRKRISIHAPPRGATLSAQHPRQQENFNSRPSARGDLVANGSSVLLMISIHAPPRGATGPAPNVANRHSISIHAPPRGATKRSARTPKPLPFQFTPLREGRLP